MKTKLLLSLFIICLFGSAALAQVASGPTDTQDNVAPTARQHGKISKADQRELTDLCAVIKSGHITGMPFTREHEKLKKKAGELGQKAGKKVRDEKLLWKRCVAADIPSILFEDGAETSVDE